jgi:hypothetical protein
MFPHQWKIGIQKKCILMMDLDLKMDHNQMMRGHIQAVLMRGHIQAVLMRDHIQAVLMRDHIQAVLMRDHIQAVLMRDHIQEDLVMVDSAQEAKMMVA